MDIDLEVLPARRRGRPSSYKSWYCDRVLYLAAEGCGKAEIAVGLGVSVKTLNAWAATYDDFREAMSQAKELEYAWWLAVGRKGQFTRTWNSSAWVRMFTKVATVFTNAATAEQSCKALSLRLSGTPPRGAVYPTGV